MASVAPVAFAPGAVAEKARATTKEGEPVFIWEDVEKLDDSPFQPRLIYTREELEALGRDFNDNGQAQAALARPHPTKNGRFQIADGHRRKRVVVDGANAGVGRPNAHRYIGKLLIEVRDLTDEQMLDLAFAANEVRQDFSVFDIARYYRELQKQFSQGQTKPVSFEQIVARRAADKRPLPLTSRTIRRMVEVLDLPQTIQDALAQMNFADKDEKPRRPGEKHCRALLTLQPTTQRDSEMSANSLQRKLVREIEEKKLSGDATLARADALSKPISETSSTGTASGQGNGSTSGSSFSGGSSAISSSAAASSTQSSGDDSKGDALLNSSRGAISHLASLESALQSGMASASLRRRLNAHLDDIEASTKRLREALSPKALS